MKQAPSYSKNSSLTKEHQEEIGFKTHLPSEQFNATKPKPNKIPTTTTTVDNKLEEESCLKIF
jgi:hypothetical protein